MAKEVKSASELQKEDWMNAKWRPMMGWTYMATCIFDFILGPILYNLLQYYNPGQAVGMWTPLTLQGGGLYHIAMGAIIGVSAYGRTQEKLSGANNGGMQPVAQSVTTTFGSPQSQGFGNSGGFNSPAPSNYSGGFGSTPPTSFAPAPSWGTTPTNNFGGPAVTASGKKIVPQDQDPVL
jgi:hypothetical protein